MEETIFTRDKAAKEHIKADILRRFDIMNADNDSDDDQVQDENSCLFDDDLDGFGNASINVAGDGEGSEDDEDSPPEPIAPETILELAYIRDPKLFNRDAETRRSKARADLKAQTGEYLNPMTFLFLCETFRLGRRANRRVETYAREECKSRPFFGRHRRSAYKPN